MKILSKVEAKEQRQPNVHTNLLKSLDSLFLLYLYNVKNENNNRIYSDLEICSVHWVAVVPKYTLLIISRYRLKRHCFICDERQLYVESTGFIRGHQLFSFYKRNFYNIVSGCTIFEMIYNMMHLSKKPNLTTSDHSTGHMSGQIWPIFIFLKCTRHKLSNDI